MSELTNKFGEYKFNLLPPKTKEELILVEERDNSIFYSFLLIFIAVLIFFILTLIETFLVLPRLRDSANVLVEARRAYESYDFVRESNGELFLKGQTLEPILDKDIKLSELLEIAVQMTETIEGAQIIAYGREPSGEFNISVSLDSFETVNQLIDNAQSITKVEEVYLKNMSKETETGLITAAISFQVNILNNG